jgi:type IV pilus assembly protein PilV
MMIKQQGITIIEVMVTIAITTVGLLGLSTMQMQSIRSTQDSGNRAQAIWVVNDLINRIHANETASYEFNGEITCDAFPANLKVCSAYNDGGNRVAADGDCTVNDMATFDTWEALCGMPSSIDAAVGSSNFIANPGLSITQSSLGDYTITITWDSRTSGVDTDGNVTYTVNDNTTSQRSNYSVVFHP